MKPFYVNSQIYGVLNVNFLVPVSLVVHKVLCTLTNKQKARK